MPTSAVTHDPHALTTLDDSESLNQRMERLVTLSRKHHSDTFSQLQWPDSLDTSQWWLPPELLSIHDTAWEQQLSEEKRRELSKWECINQFSLNVEGERELIHLLSLQLYAPQMPGMERYLHHFLDEENKHLWFFGEFCRRYGGKIYDSKKVAISAQQQSPQMAFFLLFARIYLFEEIGAHYNEVGARNPDVNPFVRQIHQLHHNDEARHIAFGRSVLANSKELAFAASSAEQRLQAHQHLQQYLQISLASLYQPAMYRDSGIAGGVAMRQQLLADPARRAYHREVMLKRPLRFMAELQLPLEV